MAVDVIARSIASGRVPITAYDMAVAGGYTGTKEQFEADMGNSGTNATNAANSAAAAAASAAEATALADDIAQYKTDTMTAPANISAGEYILAAGTLYVATANIASGSTLTPNGNVTPVTVGEELTEVIASNAQKADANGTSPNLTAGNALQLVSTVGVEDQVPYNFRASGGGADIGDRETDMIVGGTVAWNQLFPLRNLSYTSDNLDVSSASDGKWVATIRGASNGANVTAVSLGAAKYANHKMLLVSGSDTVQVVLKTPSNQISPKVFNYDSSWTNAYINVTVRYTDETTGTFDLYPMLIDLTQTFGPAIADYVYSLEQANAGDGVAWFKKIFPDDYYTPDAGTLRSVQTSAHRMIGFNAYDNATGTARLLGGMEYQITGAYTALAYSTGATITPDANGKFTPGANGILTVTGGNATTTCVHLVWDGERDGEYEPHQAWNYPLDDSLTLRGIPTLDANNKLRYDGDTYASDGTVTRKYGIVDLGTLTWTANSTYGFYANITDAKKNTNNSIPGNLVCSKLPTVSYNDALTIYASETKAPFVAWKRQNIETRGVIAYDNASTTAGEFTTAMSGVMLVYEIETPTTETADPYTNPQIVSDWGTEEYVDAGVEAGTRDVAIPVGHETLYQQNLKSKLEMMADSPAGDGDYILRQTNGENVYVPLIIPNELPQIPGTDGVYTLKATVTDGTAVLSWEAMS